MRPLFLCLAFLAFASGGAKANDDVRRQPTLEERRMMTLQLEAAGFAPCTAVSLIDSRWACTARDAGGKSWLLQLSNLDFAVLSRHAVE